MKQSLDPIGKATLDAAARLTRISMDSAERVVALQLGFARSSLDQATRAARDAAGARDVQEFLQLRSRTAEASMERLAGYSRELYEVASDAQAELSKLAEERLATFQKAVSDSVDLAAAGTAKRRK